MYKYKKVAVFLFSLLISLCSIAQTASGTVNNEQQDMMRSGGKIYVVMAVTITILAGLILFVARIDRKLSKLEKGG